VTTVHDDRPLDREEMAAWHAFIRAHARVVRLLESELEAEQGLSLPAYEVLAHLSEAPENRLRMSDLAAVSVLTPSGLTRVVDRLVREGYVERARCEADARVVYAVVTEAGVARVQQAYPTHLSGVRRHLVDRLSAAQLAAIRDALEPLTADCPPVRNA
jgi:DNA-binding MarR family transcriptional regulator